MNEWMKNDLEWPECLSAITWYLVARKVRFKKKKKKTLTFWKMLFILHFSVKKNKINFSFWNETRMNAPYTDI